MLDEIQKERYSRQIISPSIGEVGQEKISKIKVLQIGAGGLGSSCSLYLVAAGIQELTIIDNDIVDISNLQRQILYNESQVDKVKVEMAKETLSKLNSEVKINVFKDYVDNESIEKYIKNQDFIIDCSDNIKTKFLVNKTAVKYNLKCIIAGIEDFYGQIMTINPKETACYHCVFSEVEEQEQKKRVLPVIGVTPGILGTLEALEVIKTTLTLPNLYNQMLMVNLQNLTFSKIPIVKHEECICSK
ncbi:MAG: HesA/MoeB/ThiF family protein [Promethearchaeota archaeon]